MSKNATAAAKKAAPVPVDITFKCVSGSCELKPKSKKRVHLSPGDQVDFFADNRDVEITYDLASPFQSGDGFPASNPIRIASGHTHQETVANVTGTFSYRYKCLNPTCKTPADNPEMVVP